MLRRTHERRRSVPRVVAAALVIAASAGWAANAEAQTATEPGANAAATSGGTMAQATTTEQDLQDQRARQAFSIGREMYAAGRFAEAAQEFQTAYDLSHRSQLLYNLYIAYRDSQQTERAAAALRQYLAEVPDDPRRLQLEAGLQALDAQIAASAATQAERDAAEAARVQAEADRAAEAERRRQAEQDAELARQRTRPWWPWVGVGAGVIAAGVGTSLAIVTNNDIGALEADCENNLCNPATNLVDRRGSLQSQALVADILWIGGAVVGATSLFLAFALPDEIGGSSSTTVACGLGGCSVEGTF